MLVNGVTFPMDRIAEICRADGASRLLLFGSILRDDFHAGSDDLREVRATVPSGSGMMLEKRGHVQRRVGPFPGPPHPPPP